MALTFEEYRKDRQIDEKLMDDARRATADMVRAYELREARKACGMTQQELSEHMGVGQKRISALENGHFEMLKIDTLKRYIAGLGGTLEITANLPGKRIRML